MVSLIFDSIISGSFIHSPDEIIHLLHTDDLRTGDQGLGGQTPTISRERDRDQYMLPIATDYQIRHQGIGNSCEMPKVIHQHEHDRSNGQLDGYVRTKGLEPGQEQHQEDRETRGRRRDFDAAVDQLQSDRIIGWFGVLDKSDDAVL